MRAAFQPLFHFGQVPLVPKTSGGYFNYTPLWNIPCGISEIARWCFRVQSWQLTFSLPGGGGGSYNIAAQAFNEAHMIDPLDDSGIGVGGYGAHYLGSLGLSDLALYIGPSMISLMPSALPNYIRTQIGGPLIAGNDDPTQQKLFPVYVGGRQDRPITSGTGSSYLSSCPDADSVGLWIGSDAAVTFCGHPIPMLYRQYDSPDGTGFRRVDYPFSLDISPATTTGYYEYRRTDRSEPIYDPDTDTVLITPIPLYPPE